MTEFSKQYCERHMPEKQWDFDIDVIISELKEGYFIPQICEGYGFCYIRKEEGGEVLLGFRDFTTDEINWKSYADVVAPTKIRFDNITILSGEVDSHGDSIYMEGVLVPESVDVHLDFDNRIEKCIGRAELRHEGNCIKANIITDVLVNGYPCISYKLLEKEGDVVKKMQLIDVSICASPNVNLTIKTIQEQIEENRK